MLIIERNDRPQQKGSEPSSAGSHAADLALVDRSVTGDRDAFEAIYHKYQNRIYGLCVRLAADPVEAEELVQETFVKAWTSLGGYAGKGNLGGWLARIAVNRWRDRWRRQQRRNTVSLDTEWGAGAGEEQAMASAGGATQATDGTIIPLLTAMDLERCIARLPLGARTVFVLHDVEGYPHREIADQLELAAGTIKAQLHRARRLLRVMLTEKKEQSHGS